MNLRLRAMTSADIPLGIRLKTQAGWNQTEADWRRFLTLAPGGSFVAELDSVAVGTAVATALESVGWIAMILVDEQYRGQGIGTRLVERAIAHLREQPGVRSIRLDATPLGKPLYEKLGFRSQYELARWEGIAPAREEDVRVAELRDDQFDRLSALDLEITGTRRENLIEYLAHHAKHRPLVMDREGRLLGYVMLREGSRATQIGPAIAVEAEAGRALADTALARWPGQSLFVDIPTVNEPASTWARSLGFVVQRQLTRMVLGQDVVDRPARIWASSGPENG